MLQSSRNHVMNGGGLQSWFYTSIAGINTHSNGVTGGWEQIIFRPAPAAVKRLGHAAASIHTPLGVASVSWRVHASTLWFNVTVPASATGTLTFPLLGVIAQNAVIYESDQAVWKGGEFVAGRPGVSAGVVYKWGDHVGLMFSLAAGGYSFAGVCI